MNFKGEKKSQNDDAGERSLWGYLIGSLIFLLIQIAIWLFRN